MDWPIVHIDADVALVGQLRRAGVQAHPQPDRTVSNASCPSAAAATAPPAVASPAAPERRQPPLPMATLSASDVAAELRRRQPGIAAKKLHKLLHCCQAHHVAAPGTSMFADGICTWDNGPVVAATLAAGRLRRCAPDLGRRPRTFTGTAALRHVLHGSASTVTGWPRSADSSMASERA
jgi:hypothetical protein